MKVENYGETSITPLRLSQHSISDFLALKVFFRPPDQDSPPEALGLEA
ncbi:MAG: hypothetical protein AAGA60_24875 [Cyanobacteria bacterium P01_E01_bin.42]